MGLWTYPAKPPEEPYAYILDDEGIVYNPKERDIGVLRLKESL
jgi:hypothetical protein